MITIMKRLVMTCALCATAALFAEQETDTRLFLEPHVNSQLTNLSGKLVLDAGCGSAPCGIVAAQNGGSVYGVEMDKSMIDLAQKAVAVAGVENNISLCQGDVENLPYQPTSFDRALSINVGCRLPATMQVISQETYQITGLAAHIYELARVMKEGGELVLSTPASYGVVFTDQTADERAVHKHISHVLSKIGKNENPQVIVSHLNQLEEVRRATFVRRKGKLVLVTDEKELKLGEPIWRKTPEGVVTNYYHSEEEYLAAFKNAGLTCEEVKRPSFFGPVKYKQFNTNLTENEKGLGAAYIDNNPFTIFYVVKQA